MNPMIKELVDEAIKENTMVYDPFVEQNRFSKQLLLNDANKYLLHHDDYVRHVIKDITYEMYLYYINKGLYIPRNKDKLLLFVGDKKCIFGAY
jgi:hypothetical protein